MQDHFFVSALAAAKQSPEAFAAEFKKEEANANVKTYGDFGDPLIHSLIQDNEIPNADLPALLNILIQHQVNLESRNGLDETPLTMAASYLKKNAVEFLIKNKAEINDPKKPALCAPMLLFNDESLRLDIVKILLKHEAKINVQDTYGYTPLMLAAKHKRFEIMQYLLSQGADLFVEKFFPYDDRVETVFCLSYDIYISARKCFPESDEYTIHAKKCFNLLVKAAADHLYRKLASVDCRKSEITTYLNNEISRLAGNYIGFPYEESNSTNLKKLLKQQVLLPVLARIINEKEQRYAFYLGSRLSFKQQAANNPGPAIYRFFQKNNGVDLLPMIFSYAHEVMPDINEDNNKMDLVEMPVPERRRM